MVQKSAARGSGQPRENSAIWQQKRNIRRYFGNRCPITECLASLRQSLTQAAAGVQSVVVGGFLADDAVADQTCTVIPAGILPGAHPFAVTPAVGAEQGDFLAGELAFTALEHGGKFAVLQLFRTHSGAAKGDGIEGIHLAAVKFRGGKQLGRSACFPRTFGNGLGHGLGVPGAAPINNCNFHSFQILSYHSTGYGESFNVCAFCQLLTVDAGALPVESKGLLRLILVFVYPPAAHAFAGPLLQEAPDICCRIAEKQADFVGKFSLLPELPGQRRQAFSTLAAGVAALAEQGCTGVSGKVLLQFGRAVEIDQRPLFGKSQRDRPDALWTQPAVQLPKRAQQLLPTFIGTVEETGRFQPCEGRGAIAHQQLLRHGASPCAGRSDAGYVG